MPYDLIVVSKQRGRQRIAFFSSDSRTGDYLVANTGQVVILHTTAELTNLSAIRRFVEESALSLSVDEQTAFGLAHAVDELATNIIMHGYQGQPGAIEVEIVRAGETLTIVLRDHAPPFDPTGVPAPDLTRPLEEREPGGLGLYLARQMVDDWHYRVLPDDGNELTLFKQIKPTTLQSSF